MSYIPGSGEGAYEKGKKMKIASNLMVAHNIHLTFIDSPLGRGKQIFDDSQSEERYREWLKDLQKFTKSLRRCCFMQREKNRYPAK
ncbi:MAG: hypothetical protein N2V77_01535 [Canidatus Methanoxibalbensis ujae]|nr:hypothetical protein [Candidatus Methanoxibalbensis ujae]